MYIVFEGPDGSGKSTAMESLRKDLDSMRAGMGPIRTAHQPGSTALGQALRTLSKDKNLKACGPALFYMMAADHNQFIEEVIRPLGARILQDNGLLLQDRHSAISGYAYQVVANKVPFKLYEDAYSRKSVNEGVLPDIVVLFKPTIKTIMKRIAKRGQGFDRYEKQEFLERVVQGYKEAAMGQLGVKKGSSYLIVDANRDRLSVYKTMLKGLYKHPSIEGSHFQEVIGRIIKKRCGRK